MVPFTSVPSAPLTAYVISMHHVGAISGMASKTVRPSAESVAAVIGSGSLVDVVRAVLLTSLQCPYLRLIAAMIGGGRAVERGAEGDRDSILAGRQPERHPDRLAGVTDPVQAAGLRLGRRPGVHAAGVELAVGRMEAAAHDAGRNCGIGSAAIPPCIWPSDRLVRNDEDLAVPVRQVEQRPLSGPQALLSTRTI